MCGNRKHGGDADNTIVPTWVVETDPAKVEKECVVSEEGQEKEREKTSSNSQKTRAGAIRRRIRRPLGVNEGNGGTCISYSEHNGFSACGLR